MESDQKKCERAVLSFALLLILSAQAFCTSASTRPEQQVSVQEQALRKRVEEFYSLLQQGKWTQAENYLTEDSKDNFRIQQKSSFQGFQVQSVMLAPGEQSATVVVQEQIIPSGIPTTTLLPVSVTTQWRVVKGDWDVVIAKQDPNLWKALFTASPQKAAAQPTPRPEELKFKGHTYNLAMIPPGKIKVARFPFTNVTDHAVTIREVVTGCDCLTLTLEKKRYEPGESGELAVAFDPKNYERAYGQTLVVKTDPGGLITYLTVKGFVVPKPVTPRSGSGGETKSSEPPK